MLSGTALSKALTTVGTRALTTGLTSGTMSVLMGGDFWDAAGKGAISGGVSAWLDSKISKVDTKNPAYKFLAPIRNLFVKAFGQFVGEKGEYRFSASDGLRLCGAENAITEALTVALNPPTVDIDIDIDNIVKDKKTKKQIDKYLEELKKLIIEQVKNNGDLSNEIPEKIYNILDSILGKNSPDGITISLSGAFFSPIFIGGGGGIEFVHTRNYGWSIFMQLGIGAGVPGAGGSLEAGFIWGLEGNPKNYCGGFIEMQAGKTPVGVSVFFWPKGSFGTKAGAYVGSPGGGVIAEDYIRIYDFPTKKWFPDIEDLFK